MSEASPSAGGARLYHLTQNFTATAEPRADAPVRDAIVLQFRPRAVPAAKPEETKTNPAPALKKPSISMLSILNVYEMESHQREQKAHMEGKMVFRSRPQLQEHFNPVSYAGSKEKPSGIGYGAYVQDHTALKGIKLVAQVLMRRDLDLPSHVHANLPDSHHDCTHAVIEGLLVSKEYQGMGIMRNLLDACIERAAYDRVDHLHARVRVDNADSLKGFKKMGFTVLGDPAPSPLHPHEQVYFLHLDMAPHIEKYYGPSAGRAHQPELKI